MQTILANGTQLAYDEQGTGEPLVLVHGALGDFRSSPLQRESFAERYRVFSYSRRYHYPNPWDGDGRDYSPLLHAEDLAAFIAVLGLGRAYVVGTSYGAYTALFLAVRYPSLVRALVLGEPPIYTLLEQTQEGRTLFADYVASTWEPARQAFQQEELEQGVRVFLDGVIGRGTLDQIPPPARDRMLDNILAMKAEVATPGPYSALTCEDIGQVMAPTLLLTGEHSLRLFHLITDELDRCLPNCERTTIPKASHAMNSENPNTFNETVLDFLARQREAS